MSAAGNASASDTSHSTNHVQPRPFGTIKSFDAGRNRDGGCIRAINLASGIRLDGNHQPDDLAQAATVRFKQYGFQAHEQRKSMFGARQCQQYRAFPASMMAVLFDRAEQCQPTLASGVASSASRAAISSPASQARSQAAHPLERAFSKSSFFVQQKTNRPVAQHVMPKGNRRSLDVFPQTIESQQLRDGRWNRAHQS